MTEQEKEEINAMSYESMLRLWRYAPSGNTMFQGERGEYFAKVMQAKRDLVGPTEHTRASKNIGWDG